MPKGRLPAGLYWRNGIIWGRVTVQGRKHRSSLRTAHPREAALRFRTWKERIEREIFGIEAGHTFQEAVVKWAAETLPASVKPAVVRRYLTSVTMLDPVFGSKRLGEIDARLIARFVSGRTAHVSNSTIRRDLTALSRLMASCISWGWLTTNPVRDYDRSLLRQRAPVLVIPTATEIETVLKAAPAGMAPIIRLLAETGMRENEAVMLERTDVDIERRQITLSRTKSNRPRSLNWTTPGGDAGPVLVDQPVHLGTPYLFLTRDDGPYASFSSDFGNLMRKVVDQEAVAGQPFRRWRAHDLRHRFAIAWLKNGGDIYRLSRHLGHSSVRTTEGYLRYLTDDEVDVIRGVGTIKDTAAAKRHA